MNLSANGMVDLPSGGPHCPNSTTPIHPAHALRDRVDAVMDANIPRDADGDPLDSTGGSMLTAMGIDWGVAERMHLFRDSVQDVDAHDQLVTVEALYFRCGVCGLVLPANRAP